MNEIILREPIFRPARPDRRKPDRRREDRGEVQPSLDLLPLPSAHPAR